MDREQAKQEIKSRTPELLELLLEHAKAYKPSKPQYICPVCGHGKGGDGLVIIPRGSNTELKCFGGGCQFDSGDIIKLYQAMYSCDTYNAINGLADLLHISIDQGKAQIPKEPAKAPVKATAQAPTPVQQPEVDYTEYYLACAARFANSPAESYLNSRGISSKTAAAFNLGYEQFCNMAFEPGVSSKQRNKYVAPRLIIPITRAHYIGRAIDSSTDVRLLNSKGGGSGIFNAKALYQGSESVIVVEGAIDALSIIDCGYTAIALNSTANAGQLVEKLKAKPTKARLIIALDQDEPGQKAAAKLLQDLQELGLDTEQANICLPDCKDANASLQSNRAGFTKLLDRAVKGNPKPDNVKDYIFNGIIQDIAKNREGLDTGFSRFDYKSNGLCAGLYVLGAISSLGKTTFIHQMADQLAASGHDVLFFSLEQSRLELAAKSINREFWYSHPDLDGKTPNSLTIKQGKLEPDLWLACVKSYLGKVGDRLTIIEGNFATSVDTIASRIKAYIKRNSIKPIVFIDYLQILQPLQLDQNRNISLREAIDHNVTALKRLSRDLGLIVFVISSVNRSNYLAPIDFEAFKESGGIEYSADVVLGLQLQIVNSHMFEQDKAQIKKRKLARLAKKQIPRKIELVCLKNRFGGTNWSAYYCYNPVKDMFVEDIDAEYRAKAAEELEAAEAAEYEDAATSTDVEATRQMLQGGNMAWNDTISQDEPKKYSKKKKGKVQEAIEQSQATGEPVKVELF